MTKGEPFQRSKERISSSFQSARSTRVIEASNSVTDRLAKLVGTMLALHQQLSKVRTAADKTLIQCQIDATDRQIDRLVYELYGLTEAEIATVEGAG